MQAYRWMADSRVSLFLLPCISRFVLELMSTFLAFSGLLHRRSRRQAPEHLLPLPMPHHFQRQFLPLTPLSFRPSFRWTLLFLLMLLQCSRTCPKGLNVRSFSPSRRVRLPFADLPLPFFPFFLQPGKAIAQIKMELGLKGSA